MTPTKAIKQECRFCNNVPKSIICDSKHCQLNNRELSTLRRIKAHCMECVPEKTLAAVRECSGKVFGADPHTCFLHIYREGHNPKRKGMGNASNLVQKAR